MLLRQIFALCCFATILIIARADDEYRKTCHPLPSNETIYDFSLENVYQNETLDLSEYRGKVVFLVNTATYCGHVMQMVAMNEMQAQYNGDGFEVIGVPCNQFYMVRTRVRNNYNRVFRWKQKQTCLLFLHSLSHVKLSRKIICAWKFFYLYIYKRNISL